MLHEAGTRCDSPVPRPMWKFAAVAIGLAALNLQPVNQSSAAMFLAAAVALLAVGNPFTWVFYIAASQVVADPANCPLTLAQIGILAWVCTLPFNASLSRLRDARPFISYVAPLVIWYYAATLTMRQEFQTPLILAVLVGVITCTYIRRPGINSHVLLLCLVLGSTYAALGYWGGRLGIPIVAPSYEMASGTTTVFRVGSGRGDSNVSALNIPVLILGTFALAAFSKFWLTRKNHLPNIIAAAAFAVGAPALAATLSRGGLYALPLGFLGLLVMVLATARSKGWSMQSLLVPAAVVLTATLSFTFLAGGISLDNVWHLIESRNSENERISGDSGLLSGRAGPWRTHIDIMLAYPIAGIPKGATWDFGEYGVTTVGVEGIYGAAHNSFLSFGSDAGVPGFVLFLIVFFHAPYRLVWRRGLGFAGPFLGVLLAVLLGFMSLSIGNWKTYWVLLALIINTGETGLGEPASRNRNSLRRLGLNAIDRPPRPLSYAQGHPLYARTRQ